MGTASDEKMAEQTVQLAFVGCGVISAHHLDAIAALPSPRRIDVTVVIDPNPERRSAAADAVVAKLSSPRPLGFATLKEASEAVSESGNRLFEAVDIMVPSIGALHEDVAVEALRLDVHVILEKPISNCVASAERILEAHKALAPNKVLMCAENSQYWREVVKAQELIASGAIGQVLCARAKYWESAHPALNEWAADGSYEPGAYVCEGAEGFVFDGGLHWLRPLRMLVGEVSQVVASCNKTIPHMKGPGLTQALLKFESGASGVFESVLAPGAISDQPFFQIQGSTGEIVIDGFEGGARMFTIEAGVMVCTDLNEGFDGQIGWDTGYVGEMKDFASAVLEGTQPAASAHEAICDLKTMMAIMKSAKSGTWEAVQNVEPDVSMDTLGLDCDACM